jgi:hypothetical protein
VEFTVNNRSQIRTAQEGKILTLPTTAVVTKALYGKLPGPARIIDLTRKLQALVADGELTVRAGNTLAGSDPANLTPKELRVDYLLDGVLKHATVPENDQLTLSASGVPGGNPPSYQVNSPGADGPVLRAFEPGNYEFTTAAGKKVPATVGQFPAPAIISGPWQLNFPPGWGAPDSVTLDKLISWPQHTNDGVKYFSGTAVYEKDLEIPAEDFGPGREVWLDLGAVKNFAAVTLNGKYFGVLWKPPFRVNLTGAAQPGKNSLEVKVTNLWPNRLIGDEQLPDDREWNGKQLVAMPQWVIDGKPSPTGRITFTTWHHWTKTDALLDSGLLGPVTLQVAALQAVHAE